MKTRVRRSYSKKFLFILIIGLAYLGWCLLKPLPNLEPKTADSTVATTVSASTLVWPASQSAVAVAGTDIVEAHGVSKPVPTASTAKIITALMVLKQKPLEINQTGPTLILTDKDVAIYKDYVARDGSVVPVAAGEQISEYQALQTVMLPSANNMADSLAIWAYGSLTAYASAANNFLKQQGINNTHVGADASGLAADSTSTAADLAKLGVLAMQNPVLAQIVGQSSATGIPLAGTIKNVNVLLGTNGIIGVKTGNSEEAGGAYVSASQTTVNNKPVVIATAVVGSSSLFDAMKQTIPLAKSAQSNFTSVPIVKKDQKMGEYVFPWGGSVNAIASKDLSISTWNGSKVSGSVILNTIPPSTKDGAHAGNLMVKESVINNKISIPVVLETAPTTPSIWWRLGHPL